MEIKNASGENNGCFICVALSGQGKDVIHTMQKNIMERPFPAFISKPLLFLFAMIRLVFSPIPCTTITDIGYYLLDDFCEKMKKG